MVSGIIGFSGFVGSNLCSQREFNYFYNSRNISEIRGMRFDELVITGVPAVKWLANKEPEADLLNIKKLIGELKEVEASRVILISTVDVYPNPVFVNESTLINIHCCQPYGKHRLFFENFVQDFFPNVHVLRLPGLFGHGLKKNIIFDFLNNNRIDLIDSRNSFQFYCLDSLSNDIEIAKSNNIRLLNVSVEPLSVKDVAKCCGFDDFDNKLDGPLIEYDFKSIHYSCWVGGKSGYLYSKEHCLNALSNFVEGVDKDV
ncbi:hypothetical protein ACET9I_21830 [Aeromonas veronii]